MSKQEEPPVLPLPEEPFPEAPEHVHLRGDVEKTLVLGVALHCFKRGSKATLSVPISKRDDLEIHANGEYIYFWGRGRLFAIKFSEVIASARYALLGSTEKKAKGGSGDAAPTDAPAPATAAAATRIKLTCASCGEIDVDLFEDGATRGHGGWVCINTLGGGICPTCRAKGV